MAINVAFIYINVEEMPFSSHLCCRNGYLCCRNGHKCSRNKKLLTGKNEKTMKKTRSHYSSDESSETLLVFVGQLFEIVYQGLLLLGDYLDVGCHG